MTMVCEHNNNWVPSKLWVKYERTFEEPKFYPPSGLLNLEICTECGVLRVPPDMLLVVRKEVKT